MSPVELAETRKNFRQNGNVSYRYCRDLEEKARETPAKRIEYLLRRFKGSHYRKHYPSLRLLK
ncbi:MAG: hypothetical protein JNJ70_16320 [Verrucomicrobiales bacterium]|nr:hypothetical protein [Verrucomicrobiales bacterium]